MNGANIWTWLLNGLIAILNVLVVPLFGGATGYHQAMGLANIIGSSAYALLEVAIVALGNFNLAIPIAALLINTLLFTIHWLIRFWLTIKSIIKIW